MKSTTESTSVKLQAKTIAKMKGDWSEARLATTTRLMRENTCRAVIPGLAFTIPIAPCTISSRLRNWNTVTHQPADTQIEDMPLALKVVIDT